MIFKTILFCFSLILVHGEDYSEDSDEPTLQIINGRVAADDEATFAVFVTQEFDKDGKRFRSRCTGSLLNRRTVLTAAHCIYSATLEGSYGRVKIRYGTHDILEPVFPDIYAKKFFYHEGYDHKNVIRTDDIAIIKLKKPVKKGRVRFAKLPKANKIDYNAGTKVKIYGWGDTTEDNRQIYPTSLLKTTLKIVGDDTAIDDYGRTEESVYTRSKNSATCHGDSGGPLVLRKNVIIGVLSGNVPSDDQVSECAINTIDRFTKVESYLKWIKENK